MDPLVSFLMPLAEEAEFVRASLQSIAGQDYPGDRIEIVIALAPTSDGTDAEIERFYTEYPQCDVRVFDNVSANTAVGRNICLENARGELVLNFSGHAVADENLVSVLVGKFDEQADNVAGIGCATESSAAASWIGRAIADVLRSPLGGVNRVDSSLNEGGDRPVRSVAFTLYKKAILDKLGGFDADFWCGQDAELNFRLGLNGYNLLFTPETRVQHFKRTGLGSFWRQMYRYGIARGKIVRKHPASLRPVFLLPTLFTGMLMALIVGSFFSRSVANVTLAAAVLFAVGSFCSALMAQAGWTSILASPVLYLLLYVAYGVGFLRGLLPYRFRR